MQKHIFLIFAILLITQTSAYEFCINGEKDTSALRIISIDDMLQTNLKEWTWGPGETIELEARVENRDESSNNFILEITFVQNNSRNNITIDKEKIEYEFTLSGKERKTIPIDFEIKENASIGDYTLYAKLYEKNEENKKCIENSEENIKIEKIQLCSKTIAKEEDLKITKITDRGEDNKEEWTWKTNNNLKVAVELKNYNYEEKTFITELILLDKNNQQINLTNNQHNTKTTKTISKDKSETFYFNFKLNDNLSIGKYTLYAKSYEENNESNICISQKAQSTSKPVLITIQRNTHDVTIKTASGPATAKPGTNIKYPVTVINRGLQDESKVKIIAYNYHLNIEEKIVIENLSSKQESTINFSFNIPSNTTEQRYKIKFSTEFEYDKNKNYYRAESKDEDDLEKYITITNNPPKPQTKENNTITLKTKNETSNTTTTKRDNTKTSYTIIWLIIIGVILGLVAGIIYKKKTPHTKMKQSPEPKIIRRYKARLN
jgi:hypothetical protein